MKQRFCSVMHKFVQKTMNSTSSGDDEKKRGELEIITSFIVSSEYMKNLESCINQRVTSTKAILVTLAKLLYHGSLVGNSAASRTEAHKPRPPSYSVTLCQTLYFKLFVFAALASNCCGGVGWGCDAPPFLETREADAFGKSEKSTAA